MKKFFIALFLVIFAFIMISCSTVQVTAPKYAFLMPEKSGPVKQVRTKQVFYLLWGLVPLTDNTTNGMIGAKEKVVVRTYTSFIDAIISSVGSFVSLNSKTVEVDVIK